MEDPNSPFASEKPYRRGAARVEYAGFWRRLMAETLDVLITILPNVLIVIGVFWYYQLSWPEVLDVIRDVKAYTPHLFWKVVEWMIFASVTACFWASWWQATPGKRLMRVYVVRASDHKPLSFRHALLRYGVIYLLFVPMDYLSGPDSVSPPRISEAEMDSCMQGHAAGLEQERKKYASLKDPEIQRSTYQMHEGLLRMGCKDEVIKVKLEAMQAKLDNGMKPSEDEVALLRAVEYQNHKPSRWEALTMIIGILYGLSIGLTVMFTRQKTGLHDMICKTRVLIGRP